MSLRTADDIAHESGGGGGYDCKPLKLFGAEIRGLDLRDPVSDETVGALRRLLSRHKLLVFKGQDVVSGGRQVAITRWFGEVATAGFERHDASPHDAILRLSNDDAAGFRDFGTSGFHIDGSFLEKPNGVAIYHIISVPYEGATVFVSLNDVWEGVGAEMKTDWDRLWLVKKFKSIKRHRDTPGYMRHPLVYSHPTTGETTLCIHQGRTGRFVYDADTSAARKTSQRETDSILAQIDAELARHQGALQYAHDWEEGDFIISDNLALAHWASPQTQLPVSHVGLRVMHRTVTQGTSRPRKLATCRRQAGDRLARDIVNENE